MEGPGKSGRLEGWRAWGGRLEGWRGDTAGKARGLELKGPDGWRGRANQEGWKVGGPGVAGWKVGGVIRLEKQEVWN